jgi:hypothetical protein
MSGAEIASVSKKFDIFAHRLIQTSVLLKAETVYKLIAPVEQKDLYFYIQ